MIPQTFTVTSSIGCFYFSVFLFYNFLLSFPCGRLSRLMSHVKIASRIVSYRIPDSDTPDVLGSGLACRAMGLLGGYIDVGFVRGGVVVSWQRRPEVLHGTLCLSVNCQACGWDGQMDRQTDRRTHCVAVRRYSSGAVGQAKPPCNRPLTGRESLLPTHDIPPPRTHLPHMNISHHHSLPDPALTVG